MEDITSQLAIEQKKIDAIHKVSNLIQKTTDIKQKDDLAYFIHKIIDADYFNSELARELTAWQIECNKDLFMKV